MMKNYTSFTHLGRLLLLVLVIISVAACSTTKRKKLKPVPLESIQAEIKLNTLWSTKIGGGLGKYYHRFQLAVDGPYLYATSADGKVYKIDKYKGKKLWRSTLKTPLTSGVTVDKRYVYIAALSGVMIALDKDTGEQAWAFQADSEIVSPAASDDSALVFQAASGTIYSVNTDDGSQRWQQPSNVPALSLRGNSRPLFFANFVIVGLANGRLAMFDSQSGELRWDPRVAQATGDSEIERLVDVDSTPLLVDERLYAVSYQGQLAAYDLSQGQMLWTEDESSYRDLAHGLGNIYVSSADAQINAYNQRSGEIKWSKNSLLRRKVTAPSVISSYVLLADYKGYLHVLSQSDGRFVARKRVSHKGIKTGILVDGDRFYALANNGRLKAYELGKPLK